MTDFSLLNLNVDCSSRCIIKVSCEETLTSLHFFFFIGVVRFRWADGLFPLLHCNSYASQQMQEVEHSLV